jgi:hypothetical protein
MAGEPVVFKKLKVENRKSKVNTFTAYDEKQRFLKLKGCFSPLWKRGAGVSK